MRFNRLFTSGASDAYELIHFSSSEVEIEADGRLIEHPDGWNNAAVELFAESAMLVGLSTKKKLIEENTVPSWLWRHQGTRQERHNETSIGHVFDRVVGSAAYQGWKAGMFASEDQARIFYNEARYLLAQRFIGFEVGELAALGAEWSYGLHAAKEPAQQETIVAHTISNAMVDAVVSGRRDRTLQNRWSKILTTRERAATAQVHFADTEAQWEKPGTDETAISLNLLAFRHNDGTVNVETLRHAVRIAVVLADLSGLNNFIVNPVNLAPLLMALGLPYDSEAARATAAAIIAIMTAEAYTASADLAALRGVSSHFLRERETALRNLRNHRRAVYGERDDYEKIDVLPVPIALSACPDLALTAAARSAWDRALAQAQRHGLRHVQVSGIKSSATINLFMQTDADGAAPMRSLLAASDDETLTPALHPSAGEALTRLGYGAKFLTQATQHVAGALSLAHAPTLNHAMLRAKKLTNDAIARIEDYLPSARNLRFAVTPHVVGVEFCSKVLRVPEPKLAEPAFNLLAYLGFSTHDIEAANLWCYGHSGLNDAIFLQPQHRQVFAVAQRASPEAMIRMAAALQGVVSGMTGLHLHLPVALPEQRLEKLLLDAWRSGIKSLTATFDPALEVKKSSMTALKIKRKALRPTATTLARASRPGAPRRAIQISAMRATVAKKAKTRTSSKLHKI